MTAGVIAAIVAVFSLAWALRLRWQRNDARELAEQLAAKLAYSDGFAQSLEFEVGRDQDSIAALVVENRSLTEQLAKALRRVEVG